MEENFATTLPSPLPLPGPLSLSQPLFYLPLSRVAVTANQRVGTTLNRADGAMLGCQPGLCSSWTTEAHHTFLIGGPDSSSARFLRYPHLFAAATAID